MSCTQCHGQPPEYARFDHKLLPIKDPKSPVHLEGQLKTCGGCHPEQRETFLRSVHGQALEKKGLSVGPMLRRLPRFPQCFPPPRRTLHDP